LKPAPRFANLGSMGSPTPHSGRLRAVRRLRFAVALSTVAALVAPASAGAAPSWLAPLTISEAGSPAVLPRLAVNANGDALAVWQRSDGSNNRIQASFRPAGGSFGAPETLSEAGATSFEPQVALNDAGDAVVVWRREGSPQRIHAAFRPAGGSFGAPETLSAEAGGGAFNAQVALDPAGDAVAVWQRSDGSDLRAQAAFRPAGSGWDSPETLSAAGQSAELPQVAIDSDGNALAIWHRFDGTDDRVQASFRPAGGSFGAADTLSDAGQAAVRAQIAFDANGDALAVWQRFDGSDSRIQAASRPAGGSFGAVETLSDAGLDARAPRIALDAAGDAAVAWRSDNDVQIRVRAAIRPAGGSFGAPQTLSDAGQDAGAVEVAIDPEGNALAVWTRGHPDGDDRGQYALAPAGGGFEAPQTLSEPGGGVAWPDAAFDGEGNALILWSYEIAGEYRVRATAFDVAGPRLDLGGIPATGVAGAALAFSASPLDVWSPIASVEWDFGDGATAAGGAPSHAYAAPGSYVVTVTATDAVGNSSTGQATVEVAAAPDRDPPGGSGGGSPGSDAGSSGPAGGSPGAGNSQTAPTADGADRVAPRIDHLKLRPRRFRVARRRGGRALGGARVRYVVSEPARVDLVVQRSRPGGRIGGKCRKPTAKRAHRKRCLRWVRVKGRLSQRAAAGKNLLRFAGRLGGRPLRPGPYRLAVRAIDAAGNRSPLRFAAFRIMRR
jgi:hypothetical protein